MKTVQGGQIGLEIIPTAAARIPAVGHLVGGQREETGDARRTAGSIDCRITPRAPAGTGEWLVIEFVTHRCRSTGVNTHHNCRPGRRVSACFCAFGKWKQRKRRCGAVQTRGQERLGRNRVAVGRLGGRWPRVARNELPWALGRSPVGADAERDSASRSSFARAEIVG